MSFLPRQVAQSPRSQQLNPSRPNTTQAQVAPAVTSGNEARTDPTEKSQIGYSFEDIEILVCLATSDHALWSNPDLRYVLEESSSEGDQKCEFPWLVYGKVPSDLYSQLYLFAISCARL
jgi:hypothetical protein